MSRKPISAVLQPITVLCKENRYVGGKKKTIRRSLTILRSIQIFFPILSPSFDPTAVRT